jgi:hypothetical protein
MAAQTCSSSVDLPMPGSPPIRMAEPRTSPPPVTWSNSAMPLLRLMASSALARSMSTSSIFRPLLAVRPFGVVSARASSTIVFQAPQESHFPPHRGVTAPQDWQHIVALAIRC